MRKFSFELKILHKHFEQVFLILAYLVDKITPIQDNKTSHELQIDVLQWNPPPLFCSESKFVNC